MVQTFESSLPLKAAKPCHRHLHRRRRLRHRRRRHRHLHRRRRRRHLHRRRQQQRPDTDEVNNNETISTNPRRMNFYDAASKPNFLRRRRQADRKTGSCTNP